MLPSTLRQLQSGPFNSSYSAKSTPPSTCAPPAVTGFGDRSPGIWKIIATPTPGSGYNGIIPVGRAPAHSTKVELSKKHWG